MCGRTVLTAAHVVKGAVRVDVRDPAKREYKATLDPEFVGDTDGPLPDIALIEVANEMPELAPIGLARVGRGETGDDPVEGCHAIGYPWFAETSSPDAVRDTVDAIGIVPQFGRLTSGLLSVEVSVSPQQLPSGDSQWEGMSGAPVLSGGSLFGVVTEHPKRAGASTITAVPLTMLERDDAHPEWGQGVADPAKWWQRLGVAGVKELKVLPERPERPEPDYLERLRGFGRALHSRMPQLLGREKEFAEVAAFAAGDEGYRWLVGGAFTGKTALVYEAVMVGLPVDVDAEVDVVSYFLSRRDTDADSNRFLAAVVPQLAYLCDVESPHPSDRDQLAALWRRASARADETGRHLLLVVDGLDEDALPAGSPSVAALLPDVVGAHAHVLVTSRPSWVPDGMPDGHPLTRTTPVALDPFAGAGELADRARREIDDLTTHHSGHAVDELAFNVLGILTAAAGPLTVDDLAALSSGVDRPAAAHTSQVRRFVRDRAARSLERVGPQAHPRYQFAHYSLLEHAQTNEDLTNPEFRDGLHTWAEHWRDRGWPTTTDATTTTPRYLLDNYAATLTDEPERLAALVTDVGWIEAAIRSVGVDHVVADLRRAAAAAPTAAVTAMLAAVRGQAHELTPSQLLDQPGYVYSQLWVQAAGLAEHALAGQVRARLESLSASVAVVPLWTTRRITRPLMRELGRHDKRVTAIAALPDGRVITGDADGRVLLWEPVEVARMVMAAPRRQSGSPAIELRRDESGLRGLAVLANGWVAAAGSDGLRVWDPADPGPPPVDFGRRGGSLRAVAALADGRVVTGGFDGRVLAWDPAEPGAWPASLGGHSDDVGMMAVVADGRVVTTCSPGCDDRRVMVWDPDEPRTGWVEMPGSRATGGRVVAALPDGGVMTGGAVDRRVLAWDPARPDVEPVELGRDVDVRRAAALADGRVVSAGYGGLMLWDPADPGSAPVELGRDDEEVSALAALADGRVVTGGVDGRVALWDPEVFDSVPVELDRHRGSLRAVAALADGRVVTGGEDCRVLVWDPAQPDSAPIELGRHHNAVNGVAVLANGQVVSGSIDRRVLVWDPARPDSAAVELGRHANAVRGLTVLADGRVASGGYDGRLLVWDPGQPESAQVDLGSHAGVHAVAASAGGRLVTGGEDRRMLVWDPAQPGSAPVELGGDGVAVNAVAVLADGRAVTGGRDGRVLLWDPTEPGSAPIVLGRHDHAVNAVAALGDGRVVSGSLGQLLLWDVTTHARIVQLGCSPRALAAYPPGPEPTGLVIAHAGGGLSFWSLMRA